jgi:hypothetical protein
MTAHTCINDQFDRAPAKRVLKGQKHLKAEPATHIIEFPGGAVEVSRLDDGSYWAHIIVNRAWALNDQNGVHAALGDVVSSRVDWNGRAAAPIPSLPDGAALTQVAVLIRPDFPNA